MVAKAESGDEPSQESEDKVKLFITKTKIILKDYIKVPSENKYRKTSTKHSIIIFFFY